MENLEKNYDFFNKNSTELIRKNLDKYLVIANETAHESFDSELDAYIYGLQNFGIGNFILKHCALFENQLVQTFSNRVRF
jgi:hypothetical protein